MKFVLQRPPGEALLIPKDEEARAWAEENYGCDNLLTDDGALRLECFKSLQKEISLDGADPRLRNWLPEWHRLSTLTRMEEAKRLIEEVNRAFEHAKLLNDLRGMRVSLENTAGRIFKDLLERVEKYLNEQLGE